MYSQGQLSKVYRQSSKICKNKNDKKCKNCIYSNSTYNTNYESDHLATDSQECQMLKNRMNGFIDSTYYIIKQILQRYFGKVDFYGTEDSDDNKKNP